MQQAGAAIADTAINRINRNERQGIPDIVVWDDPEMQEEWEERLPEYRAGIIKGVNIYNDLMVNRSELRAVLRDRSKGVEGISVAVVLAKKILSPDIAKVAIDQNPALRLNGSIYLFRDNKKSEHLSRIYRTGTLKERGAVEDVNGLIVAHELYHAKSGSSKEKAHRDWEILQRPLLNQVQQRVRVGYINGQIQADNVRVFSRILQDLGEMQG